MISLVGYSVNGLWEINMINATIKGPTPIATVGQIFYVVLMVVIVAALAYFSIRMAGNAKFARGGRRNLEILESMGAGPQAFIHIVRAGKKYLLIGVTRGQVSTLSELDPEQLILPEGRGAGGSFESLLGRFMNRNNKNDGGGNP